MDKNAQYTDFVSHVMSVNPGHVENVVADAKKAVDSNHHANQAAYEYVDDLEKLADGTALGYNKMAIQHWYGYDQIRTQIEEGHMVPGRSIRIIFPLSGDVRFKPNSPKLWPFSEKYF